MEVPYPQTILGTESREVLLVADQSSTHKQRHRTLPAFRGEDLLRLIRADDRLDTADGHRITPGFYFPGYGKGLSVVISRRQRERMPQRSTRTGFFTGSRTRVLKSFIQGLKQGTGFTVCVAILSQSAVALKMLHFLPLHQ